MSRSRQAALVSLLLGGLVFILLLATSGDYGVTWDEAFPQFANALLQAEWFQNIGEIGNPFSAENIDEYWDTTRRYPDIHRSDHPSLPKTIMAVSYLALHGVLGTIRSLRVPNHLYFAILSGILCFWVSNRYSLVEGVAAPVALIAMPRVFGHAHVAGLDLPILVLWMLSALAYFNAVEKPSRANYLVCGVVYGLAACFKLHAFFFPFAFLAWGAWEFLETFWNTRKGRAEGVPAWQFWRPHAVNLACMAACAVVFYFATQPFLWHDTWSRLVERFSHYAGKATGAPIRLYYLGATYENQTPWHYPLVMTAVTIPLPILILVITGVAGGFRSGSDRFEKLCLLTWLASISLVLLPLAQAYDGVRLFLASFGFLAVFAGRGLGRLLDWIRSKHLDQRLPTGLRPLLGPAVALLLLAGPVGNLVRLHPFHLEYYSAVIGGIPGAHRSGLESTYWCNTLTPEFVEILNGTLPDGANLRPLCMSYEALKFLQGEGRLKPAITIDAPGPKDFHLLQCRQGMMGNLRETRFVTGWQFYQGRYGPPLAVVEKDGVPFFLLFGPLPGAR